MGKDLFSNEKITHQKLYDWETPGEQLPANRFYLLKLLFFSWMTAFIPAMIFAYPIGFFVYGVLFALSGGPAGQTTEFYQYLGAILAFPVIIFMPVMRIFNPGGHFSSTILIAGLPYSWMLFTVLLSWYFWRCRT